MKYDPKNPKEFVDWVSLFPSVRDAHRACDETMAWSTFWGRWRTCQAKLLDGNSQIHSEGVSVVPLPESDDIPVEEIIDIMCRRYERRRSYADHKKWRSIKLDSDQPICLVWLGDPHIDDNGCDWPKLREDLDTIKNTKGMYGCSLGDHLNNWVGRLARLYANQDTSQDTAIKLVKWFFQYINWLIIINGNHDMWLKQGDPIKWLAKQYQVNDDWTVNVKIQFPNEKVFRVTASHDFGGHSQWNPLHANIKAAKFGGNSHLYIAGHRHNWALAQVELPEKDQTVWLARAKGYKTMDEYALTKGYAEQKYGHAISCIINPKSESETGFVQCFPDVQEASEYLKFLRRKYANS